MEQGFDDKIVLEDVDCYAFEISESVSLLFYPEHRIWTAEICRDTGEEGTILLEHDGTIEGEDGPLTLGIDETLSIEDVTISGELLRKFEKIVEGVNNE
jgi:hypothetical protein